MTTRFLAAARLALLAALGFALNATGTAQATPLTFTVFNPSSSVQSRLNLTATAQLSGAVLVSAPQFASGGLNGQGSMTTLYNDTASNDSKLLANVNQHAITFGGGSTAVASNTRGAFSDLSLKPNVGGLSGTAPGSYGVKFSSPQDIIIPPITIPGTGTVNLGTLKSIDVNVALRNVAIDVTSPSLGLNPINTYPQTFDSSALTIGITGAADTLVSAFLKQANFTDFLTTGVALTALQQALTGQGIDIVVSANILQLGYNVGFGFSSPLTTSALNEDASLGKIEHIASNLRLTVPVKFTVSTAGLPAPLDTLFAAQYGLSGNLIGQTPFVAVDVPEPGSIALGGAGLVALVGVAYRRRRAA